MKTIKKYCKTLQQAEQVQENLYNTYNYVRLVKFPFTDTGLYIWQVKKPYTNPINPKTTFNNL